jgi:hypothetical protein
MIESYCTFETPRKGEHVDKPRQARDWQRPFKTIFIKLFSGLRQGWQILFWVGEGAHTQNANNFFWRNSFAWKPEFTSTMYPTIPLILMIG